MAVRLPADDVFINCPFDADYAPVFRALIFAILACWFRPRSARELDDSGQTRIEKLFGFIAECPYGVHDLCRIELDASNGLPRFNMPLELGIFLGAKRYGGPDQKLKRILILDVEQYRYQQFISDLAGMDIHAHAGDPEVALTVTRDWLANVSRRKLPSSAIVRGLRSVHGRAAGAGRRARIRAGGHPLCRFREDRGELAGLGLGPQPDG